MSIQILIWIWNSTMQEFSLQEPQQPTKDIKKVIRPEKIRTHFNLKDLCLYLLSYSNQLTDHNDKSANDHIAAPYKLLKPTRVDL